MKLYQVIAHRILSLKEEKNILNVHHCEIAQEVLNDIKKNLLPYGSGFDNGTTINMDKSNGNKLVFDVGYHHMNGDGYYDGWTHHQVIIKADLLSGYDMKITGKNKREIKDYIAEVFTGILDKEYQK